MKKFWLILCLIALLSLAACGGGDDENETDGGDDAPQATEAAAGEDDTEDGDAAGDAAAEGDPAAAEAVEAYWQAKVDGNRDALAGLLCADMEANLDMEATSFASVEAELEDMACTTTGTDNEFTVVTCDGQINALYGTEQRTFPLGASRTVQEDGEWKWCGEADAG